MKFNIWKQSSNNHLTVFAAWFVATLRDAVGCVQGRCYPCNNFTPSKTPSGHPLLLSGMHPWGLTNEQIK